MRSHRRRPETTALSRLRGLRPRLTIAFVAVSLVSGVTVAGASYQQARNVVLQKTQDEFAKQFDDSVSRAEIDMRLPVNQAGLDQLAEQVDGIALFGPVASASDTLSAGDIPPALRQAVRGRDRLVLQRVMLDGHPCVLVGADIRTAAGQDTGIEMYSVHSLVQEQSSINQLTKSALVILGFAVGLAVLLALLAAAGVLRPVRDLRLATRRLADGKLDTRLRPRGSDELSELVRTFNTMAGKLEYNVGQLRRMEANSRRFVADVSHELRTPLTAMTAVTEALDEEAVNLDGDTAVAARIVSSETRKLRQLVDNLIEISRFDAGRAELRLEQVDLAMVVTATLAARGWTGTVKAELPAGVLAELDRRRVDVVVANLVGNALRHGADPVVVELAALTDDELTLTVTDSGPGLPPDILPYVFERFYKADSARTRSEGSGLGLAIAWENARLHGGTLTAANAPEGGARFTLRLPRHPGAR